MLRNLKRTTQELQIKGPNMTPNNKHTVFVYGTLMGMSKGTLLQPGVTCSHSFALFDGGFPVVLHKDSAEARMFAKDINNTQLGQVKGLLYLVNDAELQYLERYESAPEFYEARETEILGADGELVEALMYQGTGVCRQLYSREQIPPENGALAWDIPHLNMFS